MTKLLLADDEEIFRTSLARRLRLRGYETTEARNGAEALAILQQDATIDVIVLDARMPGMKADQVLEKIGELRRAVEVIMLTACGWNDQWGVRFCLEKPCELEELIGTIESARQKARRKDM